MTCPHCLAEVPADAAFCSGCGTRVDRAPAPLRSPEPSGAQRWEPPGAHARGAAGPYAQGPAGQHAPRPAGQHAPRPAGQHAPRPAEPYAQGAAGPYSPGPAEPYAQGAAGPYAQGAAGPYSPGPAEPYAQGAAGPYSPGPAGPYAPGPAGPYAPGVAGPQAPPRPAGRYPYGTPPPPPLPPVQFDLGRLAPADLAIGGASLVALITLFLPWFGYSQPGYGYSQSGIAAHGYLGIALLTDLVVVGYLVMRACWEVLPVRLPVAHAPLLLVCTGLQLLIVLIAFLFKPTGLSWEIGAYLALLAAIAASAPIAVPALRWWQETHG
jgi:hypothetical protein